MICKGNTVSEPFRTLRGIIVINKINFYLYCADINIHVHQHSMKPYQTFINIKVAEHSFDTLVSFTIFSKTLNLSVAKTGTKQLNNTNFVFSIVKLMYVPLP